MEISQKICAIKKIIVKVWVGAAVVLGFFLASTVPAYAGWEYDASGWWFQNSDGTYPAGSWKEIDNQWYYFDANGYMAVGWVQSGGNWYYCNPDGSLAVNCWINGTYYVGADGAMYVNRMTPDGVQVNGNGERVVNNTASSKVDYKGNHKFKGDEWIDIKNYYWKDNAIYLQGTYCDGIQNPNPEYEADRIHFILVKENVTVIVNSNTKQSRGFGEFKEWLDGAMSGYGNAEIGVRLDGEYVTEIIDFMVMP